MCDIQRAKAISSNENIKHDSQTLYHIFLPYHENNTLPVPIWPGLKGGGVCIPPVNSSLSEATKVVHATYYTVNLTDSNQCGNIHLPEINQECCATNLSHYRCTLISCISSSVSCSCVFLFYSLVLLNVYIRSWFL